MIRLLLAAVLLLAVEGCSSGSADSDAVEETIIGVVVAVEGDLSAINGFSLLLGDGSTLELVPEEGLLFDHSGPLAHVREHMVSGSPVAVEVRVDGDDLIAVAIGDAE